ncbi:exosortase-dependent surface protein XDP2 [Spirulina sp. CCNP1310]|uniref:exosortase-dependent surface protein XDP2 n=1 Tax=Spirulina sp. CCNP1310 TaxID=3110249 RepID=UPI002B1EDBC2|nr:exosortase-dependent surface protein XDP2 [Spirulina sp. CCNP1310]MEA5420115.1 exosortase-dependent surface protein XDP2 [Spirulina sp. CCNP1310]
MKRSSFALASIFAGLALAATAGMAEAFTFKTNYTVNNSLSGDNQWRGDILLNSVEYGGNTYSDFAFVNSVNILQNDNWTSGNTGAASADKGKFATMGLSQERLTNAGAVTALGNNNLSSIIDTEDKGAFSMNIFFNQGVRDILIWERGINSAMDIQAIDASGNAIGNLLNLTKSNFSNAGYRLGTLEIGNSIQNVGSVGVTLAQLGVTDNTIAGLRVSAKSSYNGPDWKIVGVAAEKPTTNTPEPFSMIGGAIALGGAALMKRRAAK